jgi:hypothetical protein
VAYCAGLSKYITSGLIGRASSIVEVSVVANRLLKKPEDVLDVYRSDATIGLHLYLRCILS